MRTTKPLVLAGLAALSLGIGGAMAQGLVPSGGELGYYGGVSKGTPANCPTTEWHIKPLPPTGAATITGVAYFSDMSGISKIQGTRTADGKISGTVTSVSGTGPAGRFTGLHTATMTHVELAGAGCSKHTVDMQGMPTGYAPAPK